MKTNEMAEVLRALEWSTIEVVDGVGGESCCPSCGALKHSLAGEGVHCSSCALAMALDREESHRPTSGELLDTLHLCESAMAGHDTLEPLRKHVLDLLRRADHTPVACCERVRIEAGETDD